MLLIGRQRGKGQIGKLPGPSPSNSGKSQKNRESPKKDKKGRTSLRAATLQKCGSEIFSQFFYAKGGVKFGVKFWCNFPRYVFQGLGVRRKISPKFHVKNGVKKTENFTQISLCWGAALTSPDREPPPFQTPPPRLAALEFIVPICYYRLGKWIRL